MTYNYMKHHYGDNCFYGDTSYKRYARYHMPRASVNIFNIGGGGCYNTHHCCGGGWFGGGNFWSGLGLGLGAGLGNMFMGGLNMLGGWLGGGGYGLPSFGFGFPSFGNYGSGYMTPFGLGTSASDGSHRRERTHRGNAELEPQTVTSGDDAAATSGTAEAGNAGNADTPYLNELTKKFNNIVLNPADNTDDIDTLIRDLESVIDKPIDEANIDDDIELYQELLARVNKFKDNPTEAISEIADEISIHINGQSIDDIDDLKDIDFSDLSNITPKDATCILVKLGIIEYDSTSTKAHNSWTSTGQNTTYYLCGKLKDMHPNVLKLLQISRVTTEIFKGNSNSDKWFAGQITDVQVDASGNLASFKFSCEATGETDYRGKYTVTANNGSYTVTADDGSATSIKSGTGVNLTHNTELGRLEGTLVATPKN